ncbi:winged helix-turn-helix transcriptional regulator [Lacibacterium aquatile]|uniref:Winged helix-turn-helix transcriptional regulator n=1 Tax=Lacibacterium aquatile TaxID=1168082 RepID=A0ABW5DX96_9PROT
MVMKKRNFECAPGCSIEAALAPIDGKWKGVILFHLLEKTYRFNELQRKLNSRVTQRMLVKQLRELEEAGMVERKVYAQVPPRVDYSLTEEGRSLEPVLRALWSWGTDWMARNPDKQAKTAA